MPDEIESQNRKRFRKSLNTLEYTPYLLQRPRVCWVFPEPVFTPGANSVTGVHARFIREA